MKYSMNGVCFYQPGCSTTHTIGKLVVCSKCRHLFCNVNINEELALRNTECIHRKSISNPSLIYGWFIKNHGFFLLIIKKIIYLPPKTNDCLQIRNQSTMLKFRLCSLVSHYLYFLLRNQGLLKTGTGTTPCVWKVPEASLADKLQGTLNPLFNPLPPSLEHKIRGVFLLNTS